MLNKNLTLEVRPKVLPYHNSSINIYLFSHSINILLNVNSELEMFGMREWGERECAFLKWNGVFRESDEISDFLPRKMHICSPSYFYIHLTVVSLPPDTHSWSLG